jgi:beta-lactam-binding protein with PASTA domain
VISKSSPTLTPVTSPEDDAKATSRLIDGKYRVYAEHVYDGQRTLLDAKTSDGTWVTITWYRLPLAQEDAFERYRILLKGLKRKRLAAVHDVVSRPGAHYVVWARPDNTTSQPVAGGDKLTSARYEALKDMLAAHQRNLADALLRRDKRTGDLMLYGLGWQAGSAAETGHVRRLPWWQRGWQYITPNFDWLIAFALSGLGVLLLLTAVRTQAPWVVIPELRGQQINTAADQLYSLGLQTVLEAVPSTEPAGQVIEARPIAGNQLRAGREITLRYALPAAQLSPQTVPELRGLSLDEARTTLQQQGLELGRLLETHADIQPDTIIAQASSSQTTLPQGSTVDVLVSLGPASALTVLPDLRGLSEDAARAIVLAAGIETPLVIDRQQASVEVGTVLEQNHKPFVPFKTDATVRLLVASSASEVIAEDGFANFIGMSEAEAITLARAQGLNPVFSYLSRANLPAGIIFQTPEPNSNSTNSTVELTINAQPEVIPVPQVAVSINPLEPRTFSYRWNVEQGISAQIAEVRASSLDGESILLSRAMVEGGDVVEGEWTTDIAGPITVSLTLNGFSYGEPLRLNP